MGPSLQTALLCAVSLLSLIVPLISAGDIPHLRVLPLGDSITKGSGSSHGNGYRKYLRDKLVAYVADSDAAVDMVGSLKHGNMPDDDHEGHSGEYLREIDGYWKLSIRARPNVVLIHAGTNNMDKERDLDNAPTLMNNIILGIMDEAPEAVILVAPVIWANDERMNANTNKFNKELKAMIKQMQDADRRILEVPIDIGLGDLSDKKHPNDGGYQKMANAWFEAIKDAQDRGWLEDPIKLSADNVPNVGLGITTGEGNGAGDSGMGSGGNVGCQGGNWEKKGTIFDDYRVWEEVGTIRSPTGYGKRDDLILADLNNDGIADYIMPESDGTVRAWINKGKPNQWTSLGKVNPSWSDVTGNMVRMADVDNDGRADLIVLYSDGAARVWKNVDDGKKFEALDSKWATGLESREKIYFEDMDGDGFADYVIMYSGGAVKWARNTGNNGKDPNKRNWETAKTIAPGPSDMPPNAGRLYDLDGDGKSDYVIVYSGGAVKALRNTGNLNADDSKRNWDDLGTIAPGVSGVTGEMVRFADMDGDGLADFLAVAPDGSIRMWKNGGGLGSKGVVFRLADLTGDGRADVIAVDPKGRAKAWLNKGIGKWDSIGEIAPGLDEDLSSARIDFADVNGDGLDDYLVVYGGGAVKAFLNNGNIPDAGKDRIWRSSMVISPGVGEPGHKIRFADLNGDGYADYLVVYDGGAVDAYLNQKNIPKDGGRIWASKATVATGVGEAGSKITFADINGDGRAEYIVQYEGGSAIAYNNTGNIPSAGKPRNWDYMGVIAAGVEPQGPVVYADIDGDGKDDYLVVFEDGKINAYLNSCDWKPVPGGDDDKNKDGEGEDKDDDSGESEMPYKAMDPYLRACSRKQQKAILEAWREAGHIAMSHHQWTPRHKWQDTMDFYMGVETQVSHGLWGEPGPEWYNIDREYKIHFSGKNEAPYRRYAYWYCDEEASKSREHKCEKELGTIAYTWDHMGRFWSNHYVVLCPLFFSSFISLQSLVELLALDEGSERVIDNWMESRAVVVYHETMHWGDTVSKPRVRDLAYSPVEVVELAEKGTEYARQNAQSYAMAGIAIFAQQVFDLDTPPEPDDNWAQDKNGPLISVLDEPPPGWTEPESTSETEFKPHPRYGAKRLSEVGNIEPVPFSDCLHGEKFWSKDQCDTYCNHDGCKQVENDKGERNYECSCGERKKGVCKNGDYSGRWACGNSCDGGKCSRKLGSQDVVCSGCPDKEEEPKCEEGMYGDFDKCFESCDGGTCTESAGEDGVRCRC